MTAIEPIDGSPGPAGRARRALPLPRLCLAWAWTCSASPACFSTSFVDKLATGTTQSSGDAGETRGAEGHGSDGSQGSSGSADSNASETDGDDSDQGCTDMDLRCSDATTPEICEDGSWIPIGASELGCEFIVSAPPDHGVEFGADADWGVLVINPALQLTRVRVSHPNHESEHEVSARGLQTISLGQLGNGTAGETRIDDSQTYKLTSETPVVVHQHAALLPRRSAAAALVRPLQSWGTGYQVISYNHSEPLAPGPVPQAVGYSGQYSVNSGVPSNQVELSPGGPWTATAPGAGVDGMGNGRLLLDSGVALHVASRPHDEPVSACGWDGVEYSCGGFGEDPGGTPRDCPGIPREGQPCGELSGTGCCVANTNFWCNDANEVETEVCSDQARNSDSSGSHIDAAGPLQVSVGHACLNLGTPAPCSPVLGQLLPRDALGLEYIVMPPAGASRGWLEQVIRLVALHEDTWIDVFPEALDGSVYLSYEGEVHDMTWVAEPVVLRSTKPFSIAQFTAFSANSTVLAAMLLPNPSKGFRQFHFVGGVPAYGDHRISVFGPQGTTVTASQDETSQEFELERELAGTGLAYAEFTASFANETVLLISADRDVGVNIFAAESGFSYWLPASVSLR